MVLPCLVMGLHRTPSPVSELRGFTPEAPTRAGPAGRQEVMKPHVSKQPLSTGSLVASLLAKCHSRV